MRSDTYALEAEVACVNLVGGQTADGLLHDRVLLLVDEVITAETYRACTVEHGVLGCGCSSGDKPY